MISEDQKAIEQVLAGDRSAYNELVERYQRRLMCLLFNACGDREQAEDIVQEAFLRAYQKLALFSGESKFFTWLTRIAMNLLFSDYRRKRVETQLARSGIEGALNSPGAEPTPEEIVALDETQKSVRRALGQLDQERRTVILLRDFDGMDYDAIAQTLDIPIGTVRSRIHRARMELKSILRQTANQLGFSD